MTDLGIHEWEARIEEHTVGVVLRHFDGVRVVLFQRVAEMLGPPRIGLHRGNHIGVFGQHDLRPPVDLAVLHEHVRDDEPEPPLERVTVAAE